MQKHKPGFRLTLCSESQGRRTEHSDVSHKWGCWNQVWWRRSHLTRVPRPTHLHMAMCGGIWCTSVDNPSYWLKRWDFFSTALLLRYPQSQVKLLTTCCPSRKTGVRVSVYVWAWCVITPQNVLLATAHNHKPCCHPLALIFIRMSNRTKAPLRRVAGGDGSSVNQKEAVC